MSRAAAPPAEDPRSDAPQRLLAAADELIGEVGYDAASVAAIAQRAGVNKMLLFYYFGSKATLFEKVLESYYQAHLAALRTPFDALAADDPHTRLHRLVDAYFDFIEQNRRYPRLIQQLVAGDPAQHPLIQRNLAPFMQGVTALLEEVAPKTGPLAAKQFFVTFSAAMINYFTYAPVIATAWGGDPLGPAALKERREHLHWMADALLEKLTGPTAMPDRKDKKKKKKKK